MENFKLIKYSEIKPDFLKDSFKNIVKNYLINFQKNNKNNLVNYYPEIEKWFNKIIKEINIDNKKREIFLVITFKDKNIKLIGLLILKNTKKEKKICTIHVLEEFRNKGIGKKLFEKSFEYLKTKSPIITISEECYKENIEFLLKKYKFKMTNKIIGAYRDNKTEYFFNKEV